MKTRGWARGCILWCLGCSLHVGWAGRAVAQLPAPARVLPGDSSVSGRFLRPTRASKRQIVTSPDGIVINARQMVTEELHIDTVQGKSVATRIVLLHRFDGAVYAADTVAFDPVTMRPLSSVERVAGTTAWRRRFDGLRVHGQSLESAPGSGLGVPDGETGRTFDITLPQPVFDFYSMYGMLLSAFPLVEGYAANVPVFAERGDSLAWLTFRVSRRERIEAGPGRLADAWVVEVETPTGPRTLWLSRQAPYVLKQQDIHMREGRPFRIYTWLMI